MEVITKGPGTCPLDPATCKTYLECLKAAKKAKKIEEEKRLSRLGIDPKAKGVINESHGDPWVGSTAREGRRPPRWEDTLF